MKRLKKAMSVLLVSALMAGAASCGHDVAVSEMSSFAQSTSVQLTPQETKEPIRPPTGEIEYPPAAEKPVKNYGVTLTAKNITATGATLTFYQEDVQLSGRLSSPEWYALEAYVEDSAYGGHWERLLPLDRPDIVMTAEEYYGCAAYAVSEQYATQYAVDWSEMYGELPPGNYRIVKILRENAADGAVNDNYYYAPFVVHEERFSGYGLTLSDLPDHARPISQLTTEKDFMLVVDAVNSRGITVSARTRDGRRDAAGGYGEGYALERYDGEKWSGVPYITKDPSELAFKAWGAVGSFTARSVNWLSRYGDLDMGVYRFAKDFDGGKFYAYFEITEPIFPTLDRISETLKPVAKDIEAAELLGCHLEVAEATPNRVVLKLCANDQGRAFEVTTGISYSLEYYSGGWRALTVRGGNEEEIGKLIRIPEQNTDHLVRFSEVCYTLAPGTYRVAKAYTANGVTTALYAYFEIAE